jgi:hypothetical protein
LCGIYHLWSAIGAVPLIAGHVFTRRRYRLPSTSSSTTTNHDVRPSPISPYSIHVLYCKT